MTQMIQLFVPVPRATSGVAIQPLLLAGESLAGKVVGFIDNAKPNFQFLADDMATLLLSKFGVARVERHRKKMPSSPADSAVIRDMVAQCDIVIAGSGD